MHSQAEGLTSELGTLEAQKRIPKVFKLYEEYSRNEMVVTIRTRRSNYDKANRERRRELENEVEAEVNNFRAWLEGTKNLDPNTAHYYAIALKTLLLGLPMGEQIAELFSRVLDTC